MQDDSSKLSDYERENMIIKLNKEFAYAGATIPSEIFIDGERISLRSFIFEVSKKRGMLPPDKIAYANHIIPLVKKKRKEIVDRISKETLTRSTAQDLYQLALGLSRALDTLYHIHEPLFSIEEEIKRAKIEDGRRWISLVKKVYSREDKRRV